MDRDPRNPDDHASGKELRPAPRDADLGSPTNSGLGGDSGLHGAESIDTDGPARALPGPNEPEGGQRPTQLNPMP